MANALRGSFTVRFLRNGDQVYLTRDIIKEDGSAGSLLQIMNPNTHKIVDELDWSNEANQPIIKVGVESAQGKSVLITDVEYFYQGTEITFSNTAGSDGYFVSLASAGMPEGAFKKKIVEETNISTNAKTQYALLKICTNIASSTVVSNRTIGYTLSYNCDGQSGDMSGTADIIIQEAGSNSYVIYIETTNAQLSPTDTSTTLTAKCYYGTAQYTVGTTSRVVWYKNFNMNTIVSTGVNLVVSRDDIDGSTAFTAVLQTKNTDGTWVTVATRSITLLDTGDEYRLQYTIASGNTGVVSLTQNAIYNLSLLRNNAAYSGTPTFAWQLYNALGETSDDRKGSGSQVIITSSHAKCSNDKGDFYGDVGVVVDVTL